jgi:hypothetical protein
MQAINARITVIKSACADDRAASEGEMAADSVKENPKRGAQSGCGRGCGSDKRLEDPENQQRRWRS